MKYLVSYYEVYTSLEVLTILTKQQLDKILNSPNEYENVNYREVTETDLNILKK